MAREDAPGDKRLVGYVVPESGATPSVSELRDFLKRSLAEFMVPATFVTLAEFPLTPNKKVDRQALPAPDQSRPDLSKEFVAPRTAVEERLAAFWSDALGLEHLGVNDDFIELGGDSLSAVAIFLRIEEEFAVEFPLHVFFQVPTIAGLAAELERITTDRDTGCPPAGVTPQPLGAG